MCHPSYPAPPPSQLDHGMDSHKGWFSPTSQAVRTVCNLGRVKTNSCRKCLSGILKNQRKTTSSRNTPRRASPATASAGLMLEDAQGAEDRSFGSGSQESEVAAHDHLETFANRLNLKSIWQRSQASLSTPTEAESKVDGDLNPPDEVLDGESDDRAQGAHGHPESLGGKEKTSSRETCEPKEGHSTTLADAEPEVDGTQGAPEELLKHGNKEEEGGAVDGDGHIVDRLRMIPMETYELRNASATSPEETPRVLFGRPDRPDELCDGKTQVDDANVRDCFYNTDDEDSEGRTQVGEEEVRKCRDKTDEEWRRGPVDVWEPAIVTPPAAVKSTLTTSVEANLTLDAMKDSPWELFDGGQGADECIAKPCSAIFDEGRQAPEVTDKALSPPPTEIEHLPTDLVKVATALETSLNSPDKPPDYRVEEEEHKPQDCTEIPQHRKRKPTSLTDEAYERTRKFVKIAWSDFLSDKTYKSVVWNTFWGTLQRTGSACKRGVNDQEKKDEIQGSEEESNSQDTSEVDSWEESIGYGTEYSSASSDQSSDDGSANLSMASSERTGTPIWGGFWKAKTGWPSDLMSTLALLGQTKEDLWAKRREWLKKCSGFWSKREREETSRILSGQVMAGPVYGIAMDKWVNDLDDQTVRARYLTGNADI